MFWKEYRLTIWVAIVFTSLLLGWMVTWSWEPDVPTQPRPVTTEWPDFVNPRART